MNTLDDMQYNKTDPVIYSIFKDLSDREKCSWPKFAVYAHARMSDRETKEGLSAIFNLLIDNPDKSTITLETFKRLCNELDSGLSDQQIVDMIKSITANGEEITFKEFEEYMALPPE